MHLRDVLSNQELFVGREMELAQLRDTFESDRWTIVHVYGPGGIGKTTLLRKFAEQQEGVTCLYIEDIGGTDNPAVVLECLRRSMRQAGLCDTDTDSEDPDAFIALMNDIASHRRLLLLIDNLESWSPIYHWLLDTFLRSLQQSIPICTSGKMALDERRLSRISRRHRIRNIELKRLSSHEVNEYARLCSIDDPTLVHALQGLSGGNPLALSMACSIIVHSGHTEFLQAPNRRQLIGYLTAELMKDLPDAAYARYLEAASVLWRFDQDLLRHILDEDVPTPSFQQFCRFPFVMGLELGWMLHDSVRHWLLSDLQARKPDTYRAYRLRAASALQMRERSGYMCREEWKKDMLYLHEEDFFRELRFGGEGAIESRPCREQDLSRLAELYLAYLSYHAVYRPGDSNLTDVIRPLWKLSPESFDGLWLKGRMIAFCVCVPLRPETVAVLRMNRITRQVADCYDPDLQQQLMCMVGHEPYLEHEYSGNFAAAFLKWLRADTVVLTLINTSFTPLFLSKLGFGRMPEADAVTLQGVVYEAYRLDLRNGGNAETAGSSEATLAGRDESLHAGRGMPEKEQQAAAARQAANLPASPYSLDLAEWTVHVKAALKHYADLPYRPELTMPLSAGIWNSSFRDRQTESPPSAEAQAAHIQELMRQALSRLGKGTQREMTYSRILLHAYIRKTGAHNLVAEMLHLSVPTYYRYLQKAIRAFACTLAEMSRQ